MTGISGFATGGLASVQAASGDHARPSGDARTAAADAMAEIGHRAMAWVGAAGAPVSNGWAEAVGRESGFRAEPAALARGGDIYRLEEMAGGIAARFGGSATGEGALRRALEDFTRATVVQFAGLAGAPGDGQVAGVRDALTAAVTGDAGGTGLDGVIARIEEATATLARAGGGTGSPLRA